eukprot:COSAG02_NODE_6516_length_3523_cov_24.336449_2_plen_239_part_00
MGTREKRTVHQRAVHNDRGAWRERVALAEEHGAGQPRLFPQPLEPAALHHGVLRLGQRHQIADRTIQAVHVCSAAKGRSGAGAGAAARRREEEGSGARTVEDVHHQVLAVDLGVLLVVLVPVRRPLAPIMARGVDVVQRTVIAPVAVRTHQLLHLLDDRRVHNQFAQRAELHDVRHGRAGVPLVVAPRLDQHVEVALELLVEAALALAQDARQHDVLRAQTAVQRVTRRACVCVRARA